MPRKNPLTHKLGASVASRRKIDKLNIELVAAAREAISEIISRSRLTLQEIFPEATWPVDSGSPCRTTSKRRKGSSTPSASRAPTGKRGGKPKYANPADPSQVWGGGGPRPKWLREKLLAGASIDSFLVAKPHRWTGVDTPHAILGKSQGKAGKAPARKRHRGSKE